MLSWIKSPSHNTNSCFKTYLLPSTSHDLTALLKSYIGDKSSKLQVLVLSSTSCCTVQVIWTFKIYIALCKYALFKDVKCIWICGVFLLDSHLRLPLPTTKVTMITLWTNGTNLGSFRGNVRCCRSNWMYIMTNCDDFWWHFREALWPESCTSKWIAAASI